MSSRPAKTTAIVVLSDLAVALKLALKMTPWLHVETPARIMIGGVP
jgi:hypothetical protein